MILATAFSIKDAHAAAAMFSWSAILSGKIDAQCVLIHEPSVDPSPVAREAVKAFARVTHHQVQPALVPALDRWPHACNIYFASTAEAMSRQSEPWYFMEPDNLAVDAMWYYKLQRGYFASGRQCMGAFFPSWFEQGGKWVPAGKHLTGTAIYPADLWKRSTLMQFLVRMTHDCTREGKVPQAFDVYLAGELLNQSQETPLIQHTWRSCNFREENGILTFDVIDPEKKGLAKSLDIRTTIDPEAVILHGCKDGSLLNLVRKLHAQGQLREAILRSSTSAKKATEPLGCGNGAETTPEVTTVVLEPFAPVRAPRAPKPEGSEWGDSLQPDVFHEQERTVSQTVIATGAQFSPPNPRQPTIAQRTPATAPAELNEARAKFKGAHHYDGCMSKTPILHSNGSHYELRCECGTRVPLAPGVAWDKVWKGQREEPTTVDESASESPEPRKEGEEPCAPTSKNGLSSSESTPHTTPTAPAQTASASNAAPSSDPKGAAEPPKGLLTRDARVRYEEMLDLCKGKGGFAALKKMAGARGIPWTNTARKETLMRKVLFAEFGEGMVEKFETA